jgi:hypothetical protein
MAVKVTKATAPKMSMPKTTMPKATMPKAMGVAKTPKAPSMSPFKSAGKVQNGLKGAISKYQLAQMTQAGLNQSY